MHVDGEYGETRVLREISDSSWNRQCNIKKEVYFSVKYTGIVC